MPDTRLFRLDGGQRPDSAVEAWLQAEDSGPRQLARFWFAEIRGLGPDVLELLHDGHPTACVGDLPFAYVNAFRAHINVGFYFGTVLPDPAGVLVGSGRFMRHVKLPVTSLGHEHPALRQLLAAAYQDVRARQQT